MYSDSVSSYGALYRGSHDHSSAPEDNEELRVVVCNSKMHMSVKIFACCSETAVNNAETFFQRTLGITVDVAEIWDYTDIHRFGEPGETFYPRDHRDCRDMNTTFTF